jgi:hypothetical protein
VSKTLSSPPARAVNIGDVFSVPLPARRIGLCRVVAAERPRGTWDKRGRWRVLTCEWVGTRSALRAALADPATTAPMRMLSANGRLDVQSIGGPPPDTFVRVGHLSPSATERRLHSPRNPGAWEWIPPRLANELSFRRDPGAANAERQRRTRERVRKRRAELARLQREAKERKAREKAPVAAIDRKALAEHGRARSLAAWRGEHPPAFVREVRTELRALAVAVAKAPRRAPAITAALTRATKRIDRIDARWEHRIMTPDAEALVELLVAIGVAAGLEGSAAEDAIERTREF